MRPTRKDRIGEHRTALEKNKRIIYKTQGVCGICGLPVDMDLKYPDPMSKTVDHIIPISKGGHPSDLANLQLAHRCCNRKKSDNLFTPGIENTRDLNNNPGYKNNPGHENNPRHKKYPGMENTRGIQNNQITNVPGTKPMKVNNDNLPQHADWSTYSWQ